MRLLIYEPALERLSARIRQVAPAIVPIALRPDGSTVGAAEGDLGVEIGYLSTDLIESDAVRAFMVTLLKSSTTQWLQSAAAGVDHPVFRMLSDKGVILTNSDATGIAVAEFVFARVLEWLQRAVERRAAQDAKRWDYLRFREIHGSTWLVMGLGGIGRAVASRAKAFGAHVIGVRREPQPRDPVDEHVPLEEAAEAARRADVVVACLPATPGTEGILGEGFFQGMRPDSVLVNVARGSLLDEDALLRALSRGAPGAAILDVFESEPLPAESPLWSHPRVLVSAHCAPASDGTRDRADDIFIDNLARYAAKEPLRFVLPPSSFAPEGDASA